MRKLQARLLVKKPDPSEEGSPETDDADGTGSDVDLDEEEVKQELEARMACSSSGRGSDKSRSGHNLVYLDITKLSRDCFRVPDFPIGMEPGNKLCNNHFLGSMYRGLSTFFKVQL